MTKSPPKTAVEAGSASQNRPWKKWVSNTVKAVIFALMVFFIYRSISNKEKFSDDFMRAITQMLTLENTPFIVLVVVLIFLNWAFEAWKWQLLVKKMQALSFFEAFQGVLTGVAVSFVSTNYTGHYLGRVWQLEHKDRYKILGAMFLNGASQAYIVYYAGVLGLIYFLNWNGTIPDSYYPWVMISVALGSLAIGVLEYYMIGYVKYLERFAKIYAYLKIMKSYPFKEVLGLALISALRYITYCSQFGLLLWLFNAEFSLSFPQLISGISLVYLAKALIPNLSFLTDLGIREFTAIQFLGAEGYGMPDGIIIASTLTLWFLNILIPVISGAVFALKMKINNQ